jgi:GTP-binding protein
MKVELTHDAGRPEEFPADGLPEVAVIGRSNVGKSTLLNKLVGRRRLARTSGTPGKTRRIQFYRVEDAMYLVDLPGYGYAAVSREERRGWRQMVESYLRGSRAPLRGALLLVDIRRGPEEEEQQLLEWLEAEEIPAALVLTKSDRLRASRRGSALREAGKSVRLAAERVGTASGRTGAGLEWLAARILSWTGLALETPDGRPLVEPPPPSSE